MKKCFNKKDINLLKKEIIKARIVGKYFDKISTIRVKERLYNKEKKLSEIYNKLLIKLSDIFKEKNTIFKDKYNVNRTGLGFFFIIMVFFNTKIKISKVKGKNIKSLSVKKLV